ncbi:MAG TPA: hypothetical protein VN682_21305 [Terriglobales bacterium]|nr:hypothetical protein [Terriglobales bacterium]
MSEKIIEIAERESGLRHLALTSRLSDILDDSLELQDFFTCIRNEVGYISDEAASAADTLGDLVYAVQC